MPTTSYTRRDLIDQALDNLGVLPQGSTPAAEDVAQVDRIIDPVLADLAARDITYVPAPGQRGPSGGDIDAAQFLHLAAILADAAKAGWGLQGDPSFYVLRTQAEDMLRTIGRPPRTRKALRTDHVLRAGITVAGRRY